MQPTALALGDRLQPEHRQQRLAHATRLHNVPTVVRQIVFVHRVQALLLVCTRQHACKPPERATQVFTVSVVLVASQTGHTCIELVQARGVAWRAKPPPLVGRRAHVVWQQFQNRLHGIAHDVRRVVHVHPAPFGGQLGVAQVERSRFDLTFHDIF